MACGEVQEVGRGSSALCDRKYLEMIKIHISAL